MFSFDGDGKYWKARQRSRKIILEDRVNEIRKKLTTDEYRHLVEYFELKHKLENDK